MSNAKTRHTFKKIANILLFGCLLFIVLILKLNMVIRGGDKAHPPLKRHIDMVLRKKTDPTRSMKHNSIPCASPVSVCVFQQHEVGAMET